MLRDPTVVRAEKRQALEAMLQTEEGLVMLHLDPRAEGVAVPGHLTDRAVLQLNVAYGFNLPAFDIDDTGVYAVLSFGGRDFGCTVPFDALFALTMPRHPEHGLVWPASAPPEMLQQFEEAGLPLVDLPVAMTPMAEAPTPSKPALAVVRDLPAAHLASATREGAASEASEPQQTEPEPPPESRPRPVLRVVDGGRDG